MAIATIFLLLFLSIRNEWEKDKEMNEAINFSDTIQNVEIINGTNGFKVSIVEAEELNEIQLILKESKLISVLNSEDTTGYRWRIIIKSYNHLIEITGSEKVIYDNEEFMFSDNDGYTRFEEYISSLYKKYTENTID